MARLPCLAVLCLLLAGCTETLYANLSESQANEVTAVLQQYRIPASHKQNRDGTWRLDVDAAQRDYAVEILNAYELPGQSRPSMHEIFPREGFMSSPVEERARYQFGLAQELESTLEKIDGVVLARAHVTIPGREFLKDASDKPPSASIFIKYRSDMSLAGKEEDIRDLVANSIGHTPRENVSILMTSVTPLLVNAQSRMRAGWFGVHYRQGDQGTVMAVYVLPWAVLLILLAGLAVRSPAGARWLPSLRKKTPAIPPPLEQNDFFTRQKEQ